MGITNGVHTVDIQEETGETAVNAKLRRDELSILIRRGNRPPPDQGVDGSQIESYNPHC